MIEPWVMWRSDMPSIGGRIRFGVDGSRTGQRLASWTMRDAGEFPLVLSPRFCDLAVEVIPEDPHIRQRIGRLSWEHVEVAQWGKGTIRVDSYRVDWEDEEWQRARVEDELRSLPASTSSPVYPYEIPDMDDAR